MIARYTFLVKLVHHSPMRQLTTYKEVKTLLPVTHFNWIAIFYFDDIARIYFFRNSRKFKDSIKKKSRQIVEKL